MTNASENPYEAGQALHESRRKTNPWLVVCLLALLFAGFLTVGFGFALVKHAARNASIEAAERALKAERAFEAAEEARRASKLADQAESEQSQIVTKR